jgi:hypothetical protein
VDPCHVWEECGGGGEIRRWEVGARGRCKESRTRRRGAGFGGSVRAEEWGVLCNSEVDVAEERRRQKIRIGWDGKKGENIKLVLR